MRIITDEIVLAQVGLAAPNTTGVASGGRRRLTEGDTALFSQTIASLQRSRTKAASRVRQRGQLHASESFHHAEVSEDFHRPAP